MSVLRSTAASCYWPAMATRGIQVLKKHGIDFDVLEYLYKRKGGMQAAEAVGWRQERVVKSLVVQAGQRDVRFVLVPSHRDLSMKKLARLWGTKSVDLADVRDAERLTGYVQGGISPLGSYTQLPVTMEESLLEHERVLLNAGHRGILVALSPWDLQEVTEAEVESVIA